MKEEIAAYESMRRELENDHWMKWVVVHGQELVGTYEDFQEAAAEAVRRFGRGPYLVRKVGEPPLTLRTSLVYSTEHVGN